MIREYTMSAKRIVTPTKRAFAMLDGSPGMASTTLLDTISSTPTRVSPAPVAPIMSASYAFAFQSNVIVNQLSGQKIFVCLSTYMAHGEDWYVTLSDSSYVCPEVHVPLLTLSPH